MGLTALRCCFDLCVPLRTEDGVELVFGERGANVLDSAAQLLLGRGAQDAPPASPRLRENVII